MADSGKRKVGRKKIEIPESALEVLTDCICEADIANALGISVATLARRKDESESFVGAIKKAIARGKADLESFTSRNLRKLAAEGDLGALIWLEKSRLGYSDRITNLNENEVVFVKVNRER